MKKLLQVDKRTPNDLVYGDLKRYPIFINGYLKCIRYWIKLVSMNKERLPAKAYKILLELDRKGKVTWASNIKNCLFKYGFHFVWLEQDVGCIKSFMKCLKQRMIDCRWQDWNSHINNSERFSFYRFLVSSDVTDKEYYLSININRFIRCALTKFRFGVSDLAVHKNRYRESSENDLFCPFCKSVKDDEIHFAFICPVFADLRQSYIPLKYYRHPALFRLVLLLASKNENTQRNLMMFLYKAFKRRRELL